ncbi:unnamed protein product, partial [Ectocarpus sp. 6 AP-2014]
MDQTTRVNSMPPAPIFGVTPGGDGNGGMGNSKFINIDEIFADCFMDGDSDLLGLGGAGAQGGAAEGQGADSMGGGGGGGGGRAGGGEELNLNPNAAISASGGLHAATFGMGTPAMMQPQQQQALTPSPLEGMSMFLDRTAATGGGLAGAGAGSGVGGIAAGAPAAGVAP